MLGNHRRRRRKASAVDTDKSRSGDVERSCIGFHICSWVIHPAKPARAAMLCSPVSPACLCQKAATALSDVERGYFVWTKPRQGAGLQATQSPPSCSGRERQYWLSRVSSHGRSPQGRESPCSPVSSTPFHSHAGLHEKCPMIRRALACAAASMSESGR